MRQVRDDEKLQQTQTPRPNDIKLQHASETSAYEVKLNRWHMIHVCKSIKLNSLPLRHVSERL